MIESGFVCPSPGLPCGLADLCDGIDSDADDELDPKDRPKHGLAHRCFGLGRPLAASPADRPGAVNVRGHSTASHGSLVNRPSG